MINTGFNSLIEGTYKDRSRNRLHYKVARIEIPDWITRINDGFFTYALHARTQDYRKVDLEEAPWSVNDIEEKVSSLATCKGVLLNSLDSPDGILLEKPRVVFLNDGRIFVNKVLSTDGYLKIAIPAILVTAHEVFTDKSNQVVYDELVKAFTKQS